MSHGLSRRQKIETLENKTVSNALLRGGKVTLIFEDGTRFVVTTRAGVGPDSNWHKWTQVSLNGEDILNE